MKLDLLKFFKRNRFRVYLLIHVLLIFAVTLCFRLIADRKLAALVAGSLFLITPTYVAVREARLGKPWLRPSFWGALIFLLVSALPIFCLRIFNWQESFENLSLFGFSGPQLHQMSNSIFLLMLMTFFADSLLDEVKKRRKRN
jgi:hypothetical protein